MVFLIGTKLAWYSLEVVNGHGNLKQVLVGAQHKLVICGDGSFLLLLLFGFRFCFPPSVVSDAA